MAAKKKAKEQVADVQESIVADAQEKPISLPLVMPISQLNKLTDKEKQAFREAGGTSIEG